MEFLDFHSITCKVEKRSCIQLFPQLKLFNVKRIWMSASGRKTKSSSSLKEDKMFSSLALLSPLSSALCHFKCWLWANIVQTLSCCSWRAELFWALKYNFQLCKHSSELTPQNSDLTTTKTVARRGKTNVKLSRLLCWRLTRPDKIGETNKPINPDHLLSQYLTWNPSIAK